MPIKKPETISECVWATAHSASDCIAIVRRHDELESSAAAIKSWAQAKVAKYDELLAKLRETKSIADAEAVLRARVERDNVGEIEREILSAASSEAYSYLRHRDRIPPFEKLGRRLLDAISRLPATRSRAEARDRRAMFAQFKREVDAMSNPLFELNKNSLFVSMVRRYADAEEPPQKHLPVKHDPDLLPEAEEPPALEQGPVKKMLGLVMNLG